MSIDRGLRRTRGDLLARLFGALKRPEEERVTEEWIAGLEDALLRADLSVSLVDPVMLQVRDILREGRATTVPRVLEAVRDALVAVLARGDGARAVGPRPRVVLVIGVNGGGKTTTAAKLAKRLAAEGETPLLAAADTFRAAAIEQLERWAERVGVPLVSGKPGGDPAAVVFDAIAAARARGRSVVIADTAGRLHSKAHLMEELAKIARVADRAREGAPDEVLLVLDGTQGQNAIAQAKEFTRVAKVTGIVVTKLDGTAKGGAVFAIANDLGIPVRWLGVGEGADDLVRMDPRAFVAAMLGGDGRRTAQA